MVPCRLAQRRTRLQKSACPKDKGSSLDEFYAGKANDIDGLGETSLSSRKMSKKIKDCTAAEFQVCYSVN